MRLTRIITADQPLFKKAVELYNIGFPEYEQRKFAAQIKILADTEYRFYVVCDNENFVGEILYREFEEFIYIEHFCVAPLMRNRGTGKRFSLYCLKKRLFWK